RRLVIVGHGIIDLVGLRVGFGQVVIVGGHFHVIVGILLCRFRGAAQVNCLLVVGGGQFVALLFFGGISLLGRRHAVGVTEFEPDQIAGALDLVGFVQSGDCSLEVAGIRGRLGSAQFFVERANGLLFVLCLGESLLCLRGLLSGQSLALDCGRLLFLQVEVQHLFVHTHCDVVDVPDFFAVFAELDVVLAGNDAERKVLALVVGFQLVDAAGFGPGPIHFALYDRFPFDVLASSLYGARGLRERQRSGDAYGKDEQQGKDE